MRKVLIFGCGGFVGHYLSKEFMENGYSVIGSDVCELPDKTLPYVKEYIRGDLLDDDFVTKIVKMAKADYIINLAAISSVGYSWKNPQKTMAVNVIGALNILEAAKMHSIDSKILLVGSSEEYAISEERISEEFPTVANNPYGISKVTQEDFAKIYRDEYGMKIISTRTFNHTGIGQSTMFAIPSFVQQAANIHNTGKDGVMMVGNLKAYRDLGDVRDMVSAYRMILESDTTENVFNVGSGSCYQLEKIVQYIASLSRQKIEICVDPNKLRPLDNPIIWCDNSRIKEEIGWTPRYTIYDAIDLMFENMTINPGK